MRDNHEKLPELIAAYEREGQFFGIVRVTLGADSKLLEFGIDRGGFAAFKQMLDLRPFDSMPGLPYRYFFVPSVRAKLSETDKQTRQITVRVELRRESKEIEVTAPINLIQNLMWFFQLKDFAETKALKELKEYPTRGLTVPSSRADAG
jgi:hypothetical protein